MVLNVTFNNISVILWRYVLYVNEAYVPRENHHQVTGNMYYIKLWGVHQPDQVTGNMYYIKLWGVHQPDQVTGNMYYIKWWGVHQPDQVTGNMYYIKWWGVHLAINVLLLGTIKELK